MILVLVLIVMGLVCYVKFTNNKELAKKNCKSETDKANVKNARKTYSRTITTKVLLILSLVSLIIVMLMNFTDIEFFLKDFISADIVEKGKTFSYYFYLIPLYILVSRQIIIEVNLGDFLYKFFNVEEPEPEGGMIKGLLYKKAGPKQKLSLQEYVESLEAEEKKEEQPVEIKEEIKEPPKEELEIDLPDIKKEDK